MESERVEDGGEGAGGLARLVGLLGNGEATRTAHVLPFCIWYARTAEVEIVTLEPGAALEAERAGWFGLLSADEKRASREICAVWHEQARGRLEESERRLRLRVFTGVAALDRERLVATDARGIFDRMTPRPGEERMQYWIPYHTDMGEYRFLYFPAVAAGAPEPPHSEFRLAMSDGSEFSMPRGGDRFVLFPSGLPHAVLGEPRRPGDPLPVRLRGFSDDDR